MSQKTMLIVIAGIFIAVIAYLALRPKTSTTLPAGVTLNSAGQPVATPPGNLISSLAGDVASLGSAWLSSRNASPGSSAIPSDTDDEQLASLLNGD